MSQFTNRVRIGVGLLLLAVALAIRGGAIPSVVGIDTTAPFRVAVLEETNDRSKLSSDQYAAMLGTADGLMRSYITSKGGEFHLVDVQGNSGELKNAPQWVKDASVIKPASLPWLVIDRGNARFNGTFPKTKAEQDAILYRYGGKP